MVFVGDRGGRHEGLETCAPSGKDAKQLTQGTEIDADPRFSPDGKRILYTTLRGGFPEIWQRNRDGSEAKFVTKGSQGSWSPDGKSIIFIQDNQTFIRDLAAGRRTAWQRRRSWEPLRRYRRFQSGRQTLCAVASRYTWSDIGIIFVPER